MTLHKLNAYVAGNGFTAEVDGDAMTATIFNRAGSRVMTVSLKQGSN